MNTRRFYFVMIAGVVGLSLLILGVAIFGNSLLKKEAWKLSDIKAQNQVLQDREVALVQAKKDIEKYKDLNEMSKTIVPQDKDQARTVREINAIAAESGIKLQGISFTASNLGQAPTQQPTKTDGESKDTTKKPNPEQPNITQVTPVDGIPGVYSLGITITPDPTTPIPYEQFLGFLEKLENNRRTAHVDNITVTPVSGSSGVTFSLTLNAYVKP